MKRVFLIVLDSVGMGEMPDAAEYGDAGSNTILAVSKSPYFSMPNMKKLKIRSAFEEAFRLRRFLHCASFYPRVPFP